MKKSRRTFIRNASLITAVLATGGVQKITADELWGLKKKVKLRFIVASDSHYGQPGTPYDDMAQTFVDKANFFHDHQPCHFCVLNGDIIHDKPHFMPLAKVKFDRLKMPTYVTKGNHDMITGTEWERIWEMPVNHRVKMKKNAIILVTTSDEQGTYLSPDLTVLEEKLEASKKQKNVFLFVHIPQSKWTKHAIDTPAFFNLLGRYENIKAVFHGHEHDQDGIMMHNKTPFIFDSHIGGSWGTEYKGFRVVEVLKNNSIVTYMMNPVGALEKTVL